jgi:hypothetical protein
MARLEQKALDPDAQTPAFRHGVFGVQAKIAQHVLEKSRVRLGGAYLPVGLNFDFDGVRNDCREEIKDGLQLLVQIDPPLLNGEIPAQRTEPGDKLGGPVGGLAEAGEMNKSRIARLHFRQRQDQIGLDGGQKVPEIISDPPRQDPGAFHPLRDLPP